MTETSPCVGNDSWMNRTSGGDPAGGSLRRRLGRRAGAAGAGGAAGGLGAGGGGLLGRGRLAGGAAGGWAGARLARPAPAQRPKGRLPRDRGQGERRIERSVHELRESCRPWTPVRGRSPAPGAEPGPQTVKPTGCWTLQASRRPASTWPAGR